MLKLAEICAGSFSPSHAVARDHVGPVTWNEFLCDISALRTMVSQHSCSDWALFEEDAYRFAIGLFSLLAEGRRIYLPGENNPAITTELRKRGAQCMGLFPSRNTIPIVTGSTAKPGQEKILSLQGEMIVFTSGSTGSPKSITKELAQIDAELETLEQLWGSQLGSALVLGTVSHQHLYGLLFVVLWPICSGRTFWRRRLDSPMTLMAGATHSDRTAWVMSPAHLHRMDHELPWKDVGHSAVAVFSSGGLLRTTAAKLVREHLGRYPLEVLGSSETGGIAWREQASASEPWTVFPCIRIGQANDNALKIRSPFLPDDGWHVTDDAVQVQPDGRFLLNGRLDRIVKVEGKRVSLPATEDALQHHPWVAEAYAIPLVQRRQCVAAAAVLTPEGNKAYLELGHHRFGLGLREHCRQYLAAAAIPRYWRFSDTLPSNEQGKVRQESIQAMFEKNRYPPVLKRDLAEPGCRLVLFIDARSPYFEGHFPEAPILPGVTQLHWAEHFARDMLALDGEFLGMKVIKFRELIHPGTELVLNLDWSVESGWLEFQFESAKGTHSQGRMNFGARP